MTVATLTPEEQMKTIKADFRFFDTISKKNRHWYLNNPKERKNSRAAKARAMLDKLFETLKTTENQTVQEVIIDGLMSFRTSLGYLPHIISDKIYNIDMWKRLPPVVLAKLFDGPSLISQSYDFIKKDFQEYLKLLTPAHASPEFQTAILAYFKKYEDSEMVNSLVSSHNSFLTAAPEWRAFFMPVIQATYADSPQKTKKEYATNLACLLRVEEYYAAQGIPFLDSDKAAPFFESSRDGSISGLAKVGLLCDHTTRRMIAETIIGTVPETMKERTQNHMYKSNHFYGLVRLAMMDRQLAEDVVFPFLSALPEAPSATTISGAFRGYKGAYRAPFVKEFIEFGVWGNLSKEQIAVMSAVLAATKFAQRCADSHIQEETTSARIAAAIARNTAEHRNPLSLSERDVVKHFRDAIPLLREHLPELTPNIRTITDIRFAYDKPKKSRKVHLTLS